MKKYDLNVPYKEAHGMIGQQSYIYDNKMMHIHI